MTGVLVHGRLMHCVVWPDHWIHDANHNFTCLLETLHLLTMEGQRLPERLKMNLDNGPAENKNQSFLFCCWLLVYLDVFKEVSNYTPKSCHGGLTTFCDNFSIVGGTLLLVVFCTPTIQRKVGGLIVSSPAAGRARVLRSWPLA